MKKRRGKNQQFLREIRREEININSLDIRENYLQMKQNYIRKKVLSNKLNIHKSISKTPGSFLVV